MRHLLRLLAVLLCCAFLIAGCNGDEKPTEELPEAGPLLEKAAAEIQNAQSFRLEIDVNGYPVEIEVGDFPLPVDFPLVFEYAKGVFVAPDRLQANVEISLGDLAATAEIVAIGEDQYLRSDVLTQNQWLKQQIIDGFSPAALMAEDGGIAYALNAITDLKMEGLKDLDGLDVYHLSGKILASDVYAVTFGLIGTRDGQLDVDVYILPDEERVEELVLHEPLPPDAQPAEDGAELEPTTWTIAVIDYNESFAVDVPVVDETSEP
jgi:hypothetical protein